MNTRVLMHGMDSTEITGEVSPSGYAVINLGMDHTFFPTKKNLKDLVAACSEVLRELSERESAGNQQEAESTMQEAPKKTRVTRREFDEEVEQWDL